MSEESKPKRAVIIYSGGLDSTTLLYWIISQGYEVSALSIEYGQKHKKEIEFAKAHCKKLGIPHRIINLDSLNPIFNKSSLIGSDNIADGSYAEENMSSTVVANRNMIFLSIAIADAISEDADTVFYGAHGGDHDVYPDCRPAFVDAMKKAAEVCHYYPIRIETPFVNKSKAEIVRIGMDLKVDYSLTWSCYKGESEPCGTCGTCVEREEAFLKNGITDPLLTKK